MCGGMNGVAACFAAYLGQKRRFERRNERRCRMFCRISGGIPGSALMFSLKFGRFRVLFQAEFQAAPDV